MNLRPISDYLVLKQVEEETTTASGIIIPDTVNKERPEKGEVMAVGPGLLLEEGGRAAIDILVGQTVIFKKYAPDEVEVDGEKYLLIRATDVMAIVE